MRSDATKGWFTTQAPDFHFCNVEKASSAQRRHCLTYSKAAELLQEDDLLLRDFFCLFDAFAACQGNNT